MLVTINRWIAVACYLAALGLAAVGSYLGAFAWLNDGLMAGVRLFGTTAAFALAFAISGVALRWAAAAHARSHRHRWWLQLGAISAAYLGFGLAAWTISLLDRFPAR